MITRGELLSLLSYERENGIFRWLHTDRTKFAGRKAGSLKFSGYVDIKICGKLYKAHRLVWLAEYGEWPQGQIDHINRVRNDNRVENLRVVTNLENSKNRSLSKNSTSGVMGVTWHPQCKKWQARISWDRKEVYLGLFSSKDEAAFARSEFVRTASARRVVYDILAGGE